ncbi:SpdA protein, partial [Streptomyces sp. uw30]
ARTGSPIDLDTLRARLNVPPAMADAIAAQLA